jgi:hypothetical protein
MSYVFTGSGEIALFAHIKAMTQPMTVTPKNKFIRNMGLCWRCFRVLAMIVGRKYRRNIIIINADAPSDSAIFSLPSSTPPRTPMVVNISHAIRHLFISLFILSPFVSVKSIYL